MKRIQYFRLRGCEKCGGDMLIDSYEEEHGVCIQCGWRPKPESIFKLAAGGQGEPKLCLRKRSK